MKILFGWILFSSLLSIAILLKVPEFLPHGDSSKEVISQSSQIVLLDELIQSDVVDHKLLQDKRAVLSRAYKGTVINTQLESLSITSLLFALVGLNIIAIILIVAFWLVALRKKAL